MELPAASWLTGVRAGGSGAVGVRVREAAASAAPPAVPRRPTRRSSPVGPLTTTPAASATMTLSRAPRPRRRLRMLSLRHVAVPAVAAMMGRGGDTGTQVGGWKSCCSRAMPGQLQSPRLSSHVWVRAAWAPKDIPRIERKGTGESQPLHERAQPRPLSSAGAPHQSRVAEAQSVPGGFGEVEFPTRDVRAAVDDGHAYRAPAVAQGDQGATGERLVGDSEGAAAERAAAGEPSPAPIPGRVG